MKNVNYNRQSGNQTGLAISVTIDEAALLRNLVERLAHRRFDNGFSGETMPVGLLAFETSSIEAYVSGCIDIEEHEGYIALSYTTCFAFTCTRLLGEENKMTWINSLS